MPPKFGDLKRYCEKNGWILTRDTDHWYYEKVLADGTVLRTKVSHAVSKEIPGALWNKILKKQLRVSESELKQGDRFLVKYEEGKIILEPLERYPILRLRGAFKGKTSLTQALLQERRLERAREDGKDNV